MAFTMGSFRALADTPFRKNMRFVGVLLLEILLVAPRTSLPLISVYHAANCCLHGICTEFAVFPGFQVYALSILDWLPPTLALVGVLVLVLILIYTYRDHKLARHESAQAVTIVPPSNPSNDSLRASVDALNNVQHVAEHLEHKTNRLTLLLGQAQRRIQLLEELLSQSDCSSQLPDVATQAPIAAANHTAQPVLTEIKSDDQPDPVTQLIYDLADQGLPPMQIARNLNEQIGKVELILALRDL